MVTPETCVKERWYDTVLTVLECGCRVQNPYHTGKVLYLLVSTVIFKSKN